MDPTTPTTPAPAHDELQTLYRSVEKAWLEQLLAAAKKPVDAKTAAEVLSLLASARREIPVDRMTALKELDGVLRRAEEIIAEGLASGKFTGDQVEAAKQVRALFRRSLGG